MERIVVGIDGSPGAAAALRWAVAEARLRGAVLQVLHAWQLPVLAVAPFAAPTIDAREYQAAAEQLVADSVADAGAEDLAPQQVAEGGGPAAVLLRHAVGASLVVVGTRGRGGFAGLLLGSVSQQVIGHAPCPVVVVPEDAAHAFQRDVA